MYPKKTFQDFASFYSYLHPHSQTSVDRLTSLNFWWKVRRPQSRERVVLSSRRPLGLRRGQRSWDTRAAPRRGRHLRSLGLKSRPRQSRQKLKALQDRNLHRHFPRRKADNVFSINLIKQFQLTPGREDDYHLVARLKATNLWERNHGFLFDLIKLKFSSRKLW